VVVHTQVEEGKLVRVQLELAQVKADIDRRIHEKEEEFEVTRSVGRAQCRSVSPPAPAPFPRHNM